MFKKSHGKSKVEVYEERSKKKQELNKEIQSYNKKAAVSNQSVFQDEESAKNERNQDLAEENEKRDQGIDLSDLVGTYDLKGITKVIKTIKKRAKSVKKITEKQSEINKLYKLTCIDMDYTTEPVCTGCLKYQGGDIKLSHSHIISREDCKRIGRIDLISDRENLEYLCLDFGLNTGCHRMWENPYQRKMLACYEKNIAYIKTIDEGLYQKYTNK